MVVLALAMARGVFNDEVWMSENCSFPSTVCHAVESWTMAVPEMEVSGQGGDSK